MKICNSKKYFSKALDFADMLHYNRYIGKVALGRKELFMLPKQANYKVGMYLRLSCDNERVGESLSIENQKKILLEHINQQAGWNLVKICEDDGYSGTNFDEHSNGNKTTCRVNSIKIDSTPKSVTSQVMLFSFQKVDIYCLVWYNYKVELYTINWNLE